LTGFHTDRRKLSLFVRQTEVNKDGIKELPFNPTPLAKTPPPRRGRVRVGVEKRANIH